MSRSRRAVTTALVGVGVLLVLSACAGAAGPNNVATVNAAHLSGFWPGLWHGLILPVTFIVSLFNHNVGIYEVHNTGTWYNVGFALGLATSIGALSRGPGSTRPGSRK
ncbi:hypothetical protein [Longispora urticae]